MTLKTLFKTMLAWLLFTSHSSQGTAYVPESDEVIVFKPKNLFVAEDHSQNINQAIAAATKLLNQAAQIGYDSNYDQAKRLLSGHIKNQNNMELFYLWAKIKQHEHQFDEALTWLNKIFTQQKNHVAARLMASRVALIQNNAQLAQSHCTKIIAVTDILTSSICLLEAQSHFNTIELSQSYQDLTALANKHPIPESHKIWLNLMLADMAERLSLVDEAKTWVNLHKDFNQSSYLFAWADIHLQTDEFQLVLDQLTATYNNIQQNDKTASDGLLLRMALAEQQLNKQNSSNNNRWYKAISKRIRLRELRQDTAHANEMAQYYLYLKHNTPKALHWAKINWENAKEYKDKQLLQQAKNKHQAENT